MSAVPRLADVHGASVWVGADCVGADQLEFDARNGLRLLPDDLPGLSVDDDGVSFERATTWEAF